jgi:hypothetical protein
MPRKENVMALAKCVRRCWDSSISRRYWPGDRDDIDPARPVAKHFQFDDPSIKCTYVKGAVKVEAPKAEPPTERTELGPSPDPSKFGDTEYPKKRK